MKTFIVTVPIKGSVAFSVVSCCAYHARAIALVLYAHDNAERDDGIECSGVDTEVDPARPVLVDGVELPARAVGVVTLHAHFNEGRLASVVREMRTRGAPTLRGHYDKETNLFFLFEGTHRIRAAHTLGLIPVLVSEPWTRGPYALARARYAASQPDRLFRFEHATVEGRYD